jgi:hypothetical protein
VKNPTLLLLVVILIAQPVDAQFARAQMMGSQMGPMMQGEHSLMAWLNGAELKATPAQPEPKLDSRMRSLGEGSYKHHCAVCHDEKGDGKGPQAAGLRPPPRDFTKGVYKFRSTPGGTLPTDEDVWKTISNGLHGTAMVPWISLSENER